MKQQSARSEAPVFQGFTQETAEFLWELGFHNERPWFQEHREVYQRVLHEPFHALAETVMGQMQLRFPEENFALHVSRIYRDARRLFGRGPYKDHLWFTVYNGDNRHTEGPMFWFELSAATFSYGIGFFDVTPAEMEAFRGSIDANPARFERLVTDAGKLPGFQVTGPEYRRPKKDLGPVLNPWYNRKRVGLEHVEDFDPEALGQALPEVLCRAFSHLMPLYRYFTVCSRAAAGQNSDELRRINHGTEETAESLGHHAGLQL